MIERNLMIGALTSDGMFPAMLSKAEAEKLTDAELYDRFLELEQMEKGGGTFDKQKETHGTFATFVWIVSGIYLFVSSENISLLSWQGALFIFIGMFAAATIFGLLSYGIQRGVAKLVAIMMTGPASNGTASAIRVLGLVIMLLEAVLIFYVAGIVFALFA